MALYYSHMFTQIIESIGLPDKEAVVYNALLLAGNQTIAQLKRHTPGITRSNLYALLYSLKQKGLVIEAEIKGKKVFSPAQPGKLTEYADSIELKQRAAREQLGAAMADMTSKWNLASGKPGVRFFEGPDAIKATANDSLTSETEILSYVDMDRLAALLKAENQRYVGQRKGKGIKKRIIYQNSPLVQKDAPSLIDDLTDIRIVNDTEGSFATVMQIYDNRVSYLTLDPKRTIGVIIQDPSIYQMHVALFENTWHNAKKLL